MTDILSAIDSALTGRFRRVRTLADLRRRDVGKRISILAVDHVAHYEAGLLTSVRHYAPGWVQLGITGEPGGWASEPWPTHLLCEVSNP